MIWLMLERLGMGEKGPVDSMFWYFTSSAKGKTSPKNALKRDLRREKKPTDIVKPVLVVSGIKRHSAFLQAEYVASLHFPSLLFI